MHYKIQCVRYVLRYFNVEVIERFRFHKSGFMQ